MATTTFISVQEYLHTSYRPDVDYVEGELQERNLGEQWHSMVQAAIILALGNHRKDWRVRVLPEQRVQVTANRFRVPDVCIIPAAEAVTPILTTAPLLCVEILSPEDRFSRVLERVREYIDMGVRAVWIIDPLSRDVWTVGASGDAIQLRSDTLTLDGTPVAIAMADLFAEIDEAPKA